MAKRANDTEAGAGGRVSASDTGTARLDNAVHRFMRYFMVHINPILHRSAYRGRNYSEYEIVVLMALSFGPTRPVDLSRVLRIEKGTLTSLIRRLQRLDLIEKRAISGDERSYLVALTPDGTAFTRHLERQRHRQFELLFAAMDEEALGAAVRGFDLLSAYLEGVENGDAGKG